MQGLRVSVALGGPQFCASDLSFVGWEQSSLSQALKLGMGWCAWILS